MYPPPERQKLGAKRQFLENIKEKKRQVWLARVAYLIQSRNKEYLKVKQTSPERAGDVVESFERVYNSEREAHEREMDALTNQILEINKGIERLAGMGY